MVTYKPIKEIFIWNNFLEASPTHGGNYTAEVRTFNIAAFHFNREVWLD